MRFFIYQKDIANVDIIMIYCYQKATSYNWGCSIQLCSGWSESLCWGFLQTSMLAVTISKKLIEKEIILAWATVEWAQSLLLPFFHFAFGQAGYTAKKVTEKWRYLNWCLSHLIFFVLVRENAKLRNNNTTASFLTHWRISKLTFWRTIKP